MALNHHFTVDDMYSRGLWRTSAVFQEAVGTQSSSGSSQTSHQPPQGSREGFILYLFF